ncbi:MAG: hypothetical protein A2X49_07210 [Lentisphaerae bacterium GWF2_52_8]|nr:MAG: hypothetical protein A2X49_07210 [Lentisphaerae bacterium GWF2_52_8]
MNNLLHRVVILISFMVALVCLIWNWLSSGDLLYAAFIGIAVLFTVSIVLLLALEAIARVLFKHLQEKRIAQAKQAALAKQKGVK